MGVEVSVGVAVGVGVYVGAFKTRTGLRVEVGFPTVPVIVVAIAVAAAVSWPDEEVSELLRTYPSRGDQVRILWNLLVIADQEGRNYHVSRETLRACWFTNRPGQMAGPSLYNKNKSE